MKSKFAEVRKLNIGCGFDHREGYINIDLHERHDPDVVADATDLRMFEDRTCKEVLAKDLLEHLPRAKTRTALLEWNRVLEDAGKLCMVVPNVIGVSNLLQQEERQTMEEQELLLQCLFGTQGYTGDFHFIGFTEFYLRGLLEESGFVVETLVDKDEWLFDVVAIKKEHKFPEPIYMLNGKAFIMKLYEVYLNRAPEEEAIEYFEGVLADGIAKEEIINRIKNSEEYRSLQS